MYVTNRTPINSAGSGEGSFQGSAQVGGVEVSIEDIKAETKKKLAGLLWAGQDEITGEELLNRDVQELPCLWGKILQKTGVACLAGGSDTGKSSFLRDLAINCAVGNSDFLGFALNTTHQSVIFVSTEDDQQATAFLLSRQARAYTRQQLKRLRFLFDTTNLLEQLDASLTSNGADLIVVDCFADAYGGDLKDSQKMRTYLHQFQLLAEKHQCLILFLHHTSKRTEGVEPSKNNLLSGQGFEAKMRLVMELRIDLMDPGCRHLCIVKGNYLPASLKRESFVLRFDEGSFTFSNTGERMPFELLAKQGDDGGKGKYEQAKVLKDSGYTYEQIASAIGYASKGSVTKLFEKGKNHGWDR